ncbi:MAG TPA: LysR family transcriptional regulator [Treponema sp.]|nr:LysR family transcriptional regulator [Treponema sp.]
MVDQKIITLLTLAKTGNYTKAADILCITQPAVSHQIRLLEAQYGIKIFTKGRKGLKTTPEGDILLEYARKAVSLSERVKQAIEDSRNCIQRFTVGVTPTLGESIVSQIFAPYCREHPEAHIAIVTHNLKKIGNMLKLDELDWAIVDGTIPGDEYASVLLDTDYLCLVVSPMHRFAKMKTVSLSELKKEKLIMRSPNTGTRTLFENHLLSRSEDIRNFNIIIEIDNITTIKELVSSNLGVSIIAHSACKAEEASGTLVVVPIQNLTMIREINCIFRKDSRHMEILEDIDKIYTNSDNM